MNIFESELELIEVLDKHEKLIFECINGDLGFTDFCDKYGSFYGYYALDGHESDEIEREMLFKHEDRIEFHRIIAEEILGNMCSEEDAKKQIYIDAGRYGIDVAFQKLKEHVKKSY